jgi:hypothetical protein
VEERLARVLDAVSRGPLSAFDIVPFVYDDPLAQQNAQRLLSEVLAYLAHLQAECQVERVPGEPERWAA